MSLRGLLAGGVHRGAVGPALGQSCVEGLTLVTYTPLIPCCSQPLPGCPCSLAPLLCSPPLLSLLRWLLSPPARIAFPWQCVKGIFSHPGQEVFRCMPKSLGAILFPFFCG